MAPVEFATLFTPLTCGGGLLFGCLIFFYLFLKTSDSLHLGVALLALSAFGLVFMEGLILYFGGVEGRLFLARQLFRLEQLSGLSFLFTFPFFIGRFLKLGGRAGAVNAVLTWSGLGAVILIGAAAFSAPDLFVSMTVPDPDWMVSAADYGRGRPGPLYALRDALLGLLFLYCLGMTVRELPKRENRPYLIPMLAGLLFAMFMSIDDIQYVHTQRHIGPFPSVAYSRFAVGISLFVLLSMGTLMKRYVEGARQRERAYAALKRSRRELLFLAYHDPVTGLKNRKALMERLEEVIAEAERASPPAGIGLLVFHCGDLKEHGDRLGPELGDWLAAEIAARLKRVKRRSDYLFKIDAEEFALVLTAVKDETHCAIVAEKFISELRKPYTSWGNTLYVSPRAGIAVYPRDDARDGAALARNAGAALSEAKAQGADYQFYTESIQNKALERMGLLHSLRSALDNGQFELHYQPQVDHDGRIVGAEALIRWTIPGAGPVSPGRFIPLAEETGLIIPLGRWVMTRACAQAKAWRDSGFDIPVSVNLSSKQMQDKHLLSLVENSVANNGLAPHDLHIEITESSLMTDLDKNINTLRSIQELGCSFSIDDFGTGYSSLSYLKRLPVRAIKIDRSFVVDLPDDPQDCALVRAITAMARGLGMDVIAEGVENERQIDFLRSADCRIIQGYYYSRPLPYDRFVEYAAKSPHGLV
jgi:diguanylate cyclase (GGDEF)-like protein